MPPLQLPPELERRITALAAQTHREPQSVLTDLVEAGLDEDEALRLEVRAGLDELDRGEGIDHDEAEQGAQAPPLPHDWNDYLRYRFEQGRAAIARGEYSEASPAELIARVRARVERRSRRIWREATTDGARSKACRR
jgi:predicted transcriptional regulator